ncbi:LacI family transcriptional regulator [Lachnospiraceae bacterium OF09-33XD]|nr:LacI family transcriptional regulator [Lachnospiraceae bacterium OF09-33XD]
MGKRVTIKDIAEECHVSITTVSRILNNKKDIARLRLNRRFWTR